MSNIEAIIFACPSGLAISSMGAGILKKEFAQAGIDLPVTYKGIHQVSVTANQLIIVQSDFLESACRMLPNAQIYPIKQILDVTEYQSLIHMLRQS